MALLYAAGRAANRRDRLSDGMSAGHLADTHQMSLEVA
jgi:hypothetical protein